MTLWAQTGVFWGNAVMLGSLVVIGIALPFIAMITLGLLKERTEKHGKTDSWFARFTAIVAAGIYGADKLEQVPAELRSFMFLRGKGDAARCLCRGAGWRCRRSDCAGQGRRAGS